MTKATADEIVTASSSATRRFKVLLIAYACEPGRGSEPGTGWNMALGLAKFHNVTVATRANNRTTIEKFLATYCAPAPDFMFVDPPSWTLKLKKRGLMPVQLFYLFWQIEVARMIKSRTDDFDILHQLTFNSFEVPPFAFHSCKATKVWGPIGGGQTVPTGMLRAFGCIGGVKEWMRNMRVRLSAANPLVTRTLRQCSLVLFANEETKNLLSKHCTGNIGSMVDVGVDEDKFMASPNRTKENHLTLLSAGRLENRKGVLVLIDAFADLAKKYPHLRLRMVGTGPLYNKILRRIDRLQISNSVTLTGSVDHDVMQREFAAADLFVFPSLRDTSGAVVLEAMATGLPVACFDHQGAALMVKADCGTKAIAHEFNEAISTLHNAIERLVADSDFRKDCGHHAMESITSIYDWKSKSLLISDHYHSLHGQI
jgi:glycosyltransferase involved in cell wall biosynthesis